MYKYVLTPRVFRRSTVVAFRIARNKSLSHCLCLPSTVSMRRYTLLTMTLRSSIDNFIESRNGQLPTHTIPIHIHVIKARISRIYSGETARDRTNGRGRERESGTHEANDVSRMHWIKWLWKIGYVLNIWCVFMRSRIIFFPSGVLINTRRILNVAMKSENP